MKKIQSSREVDHQYSDFALGPDIALNGHEYSSNYTSEKLCSRSTAEAPVLTV